MITACKNCKDCKFEYDETDCPGGLIITGGRCLVNNEDLEYIIKCPKLTTSVDKDK
jgi:hypothetical protein